MTEHQKVFLKLHQDNSWRTHESESGFGSSVSIVIPYYIPMLQDFIFRKHVKTISDLGCGDFNFGDNIYSACPGISYIGYDCCPFLVEQNKEKYPGYEFEHLDFYASPKHIRPADLFILKDVLQHWSNREISGFLTYLVGLGRFKYLLVTNSTTSKDIVFEDIQTGGYRPLAWTHEVFRPFNPVLIGQWGEPDFFSQVGDKWLPCLFDTFLIEKPV